MDPVPALRSQIRGLRAEESSREQEVPVLKVFGKCIAQNPDHTPDQAKTFSDTLSDKVPTRAEIARDIDKKMLLPNLKSSVVHQGGHWARTAEIDLL